MKYLLAVFLLASSSAYGLSPKQKMPEIVILYPDGSYYTVAYGEEVYVSDGPVYSLQGEDLQIRLIQIEPWDKRDFEFEVDIDVVPPPKVTTGEKDF